MVVTHQGVTWIALVFNFLLRQNVSQICPDLFFVWKNLVLIEIGYMTYPDHTARSNTAGSETSSISLTLKGQRLGWANPGLWPRKASQGTVRWLGTNHEGRAGTSQRKGRETPTLLNFKIIFLTNLSFLQMALYMYIFKKIKKCIKISTLFKK